MFPVQSINFWASPIQIWSSSYRNTKSKCQRPVRISTWCRPRWDLHSDSARRSKSSCRCLLDDRLWWHESTGHTGDACRLCNVCREESQICDTDKDKGGRREQIRRCEWREQGKTFTFLLYMDRNVCFVYFLRSGAEFLLALRYRIFNWTIIASQSKRVSSLTCIYRSGITTKLFKCF